MQFKKNKKTNLTEVTTLFNCQRCWQKQKVWLLGFKSSSVTVSPVWYSCFSTVYISLFRSVNTIAAAAIIVACHFQKNRKEKQQHTSVWVEWKVSASAISCDQFHVTSCVKGLMLWAINGIVNPCYGACCCMPPGKACSLLGFDLLLHEAGIGTAWVMWAASELKTVLHWFLLEMSKVSEPSHGWGLFTECAQCY